MEKQIYIVQAQGPYGCDTSAYESFGEAFNAMWGFFDGVIPHIENPDPCDIVASANGMNATITPATFCVNNQLTK